MTFENALREKQSKRAVDFLNSLLQIHPHPQDSQELVILTSIFLKETTMLER